MGTGIKNWNNPVSGQEKTPLVFLGSTIRRNPIKLTHLLKEILCLTTCSEVNITPKTGPGF